MSELRLLPQYDDLVACAYRSAADNRPWQTFVEKLAATANVQQASLLIVSEQPWASPALITSQSSPELADQGYFERVMATETMHRLNATPASEPVALEEMLSPPQLRNTELYQQFLRPRDVEYSLIIDVWRDHGIQVRLAVDRTSLQGPFDGSERDALMRLTQHLRNGIEWRKERETRGALSHLYNAAMDRRGIAVFLLNDHGTLLGTNRRGETLLQRGQGLQVQRGRLIASGSWRGEWQALRRDLRQAEENRPHGRRLFDAHGNGVLDVVGHRLAGVDAADPNSCTVVLLARPGDDPTPRLDPKLLKSFYGFTDRETELALALTQGQSTADIARSLGVAPNTVKTHIRAVFEKTGCSKQSQVVALLLGNDALH